MSTVLPPNKIGTGDSATVPQTRYSFIAPSDNWILDALIGMMWDYTQESTWYQSGTLTVPEVSEIFTRIWETFGVDMATVGAIIPYAGGILPTGWIPCDGRSLVRVDYTALFAAIGTVWGAADSTHFNVPDLRGKTLVGQGTNPDTGTTFNLGDSAGEETHTLTTSEIPAHTHTDTGHTHVEGNAIPAVSAAIVGVPIPSAIPSVGVTGSGSAILSNTGGGGSHNNMQVYGVVNYAIIS